MAAPFKLYRQRDNGWCEYYIGNWPHRRESWSPSATLARTYWTREQAVNAREHISAHTSGASIRIESA